MIDDSEFPQDDESEPFGDARWAAERIQEIRDVLHAFDATTPKEMTTLFYIHGYNELELAVRDLLRIMDKRQDS